MFQLTYIHYAHNHLIDEFFDFNSTCVLNLSS